MEQELDLIFQYRNICSHLSTNHAVSLVCSLLKYSQGQRDSTVCTVLVLHTTNSNSTSYTHQVPWAPVEVIPYVQNKELICVWMYIWMYVCMHVSYTFLSEATLTKIFHFMAWDANRKCSLIPTSIITVCYIPGVAWGDNVIISSSFYSCKILHKVVYNSMLKRKSYYLCVSPKHDPQ